jgi:hypothetical protein
LREEATRLLAEEEEGVRAKLRGAGMSLPLSSLADLKPQAIYLEAAKLAQGDAVRERSLRADELNKILAQEPPRRTVTGSFRVH